MRLTSSGCFELLSAGCLPSVIERIPSKHGLVRYLLVFCISVHRAGQAVVRVVFWQRHDSCLLIETHSFHALSILSSFVSFISSLNETIAVPQGLSFLSHHQRRTYTEWSSLTESFPRIPDSYWPHTETEPSSHARSLNLSSAKKFSTISIACSSLSQQPPIPIQSPSEPSPPATMSSTDFNIDQSDLEKLNDKDKAELRQFFSNEEHRARIQARTCTHTLPSLPLSLRLPSPLSPSNQEQTNKN